MPYSKSNINPLKIQTVKHNNGWRIQITEQGYEPAQIPCTYADKQDCDQQAAELAAYYKQSGVRVYAHPLAPHATLNKTEQ